MKWLLLLMLSPAAMAQTDMQAFNIAYHNFTYEADTDNVSLYEDVTRTVPSNIHKEFSGDCEQFAISLYNEIGGEVWYVRIKQGKYKGQYHMVLVKDGYVYDNVNKRNSLNFYSRNVAYMFYPVNRLFRF